MKKLLPVVVVFLIIILNTIRVVASDKLNIVNEFVITGDSAKFYFPPVATINEDKLYLFFSQDNNDRTLCYNLKGEKIGQNKFSPFTSDIRRIDFYDNYLSVKLFYGLNDTIYYFNFVYSKDFKTVDKIIEKTYFDGYIRKGATDIPRKGDSLFFLIYSTDKETGSKRRYHIITTDMNYRILNIVDLDASSIDSDVWQGGTPLHYLDNGHFIFTMLKSKNGDGNPYNALEYKYEFDFSGKYYSKKLVENKIVYENDTFNVQEYAVGKTKDFSWIVFSKLSNSSKIIKCLIKYAPNGEIDWIEPIEDNNNSIDILGVTYLEKSEIIAASGRFFPDGNTKNPYGSYLQLFDKNGKHLESYAWQRNKYLDCTVFNVVEAPNNHLFIIAKNGSDSLVITEVIPKYLSNKENNASQKIISPYPNPAHTTTRLNLQQEGQVSITAVDLLGRSFPLWSGYTSTGTLELDVSTLPTGSYTILIDYGTKREAVRMMIE